VHPSVGGAGDASRSMIWMICFEDEFEQARENESLAVAQVVAQSIIRLRHMNPLRQFYDGACRIQMSDNFAVSYVSRLLFPMARYKQSLYATHLEIILNLPRYMYVQIGLRLTFTPKHIFP
jgi:hypothetical protein